MSDFADESGLGERSSTSYPEVMSLSLKKPTWLPQPLDLTPQLDSINDPSFPLSNLGTELLVESVQFHTGSTHSSGVARPLGNISASSVSISPAVKAKSRGRAILKPRSLAKAREMGRASWIGKHPIIPMSLLENQMSIDVLSSATNRTSEGNREHDITNDNSSTRLEISAYHRETAVNSGPLSSLLVEHRTQQQAFSIAVVQGHWLDAEEILFDILNIPKSQTDRDYTKFTNDIQVSVFFSLQRQVFMELLEEMNASEALVLLQDKLKPLAGDKKAQDLNFLSRCVSVCDNNTGDSFTKMYQVYFSAHRLKNSWKRLHETVRKVCPVSKYCMRYPVSRRSAVSLLAELL
jgi:hypothetical protein